MEAETSKTGIHSPGSRSGTSRIVEQPEEYEIFFYSPFIIMPDMAEGCDSAFIGGTLINGDPRWYRAGNDRESDSPTEKYTLSNVRSSDDGGFRPFPPVPGLLISCCLFSMALGGGSVL